ncbi:putative HTH-type transcriptional regulator in himA 3'region [Geobacter sp. OR-1]|uniref:MerR family transcriptional regulator n=1 Tax=Geobacter sp. OR-1 TaxID=1266765 RepID=UPI000541F9C7|nr:MerR family transcriptional regulator [Geobacter sp. OR-1]GAM09933.1 putative HTH-type transcriptional regulator in himA 3'region [Geobacter sp. OR-1]
MDLPLPDKLYYKIGEISKALTLNPSVLRFWETEFSQLKPRKSSTGQRLYSRDDLELLIKIRKLLYKDKLTIEGARRVITGMAAPPPTPPEEPRESSETIRSLLHEIRTELQICRNILES